MFNALIIGGGVAGMQCALVLGSGLKKPYAENKKVGVIMHQRSSHLQNALFNNVLGLPSGTLGSDVLTAGKKQLTTKYPDVTQIEGEKVISNAIQNHFHIVKTNKKEYKNQVIVLALIRNTIIWSKTNPKPSPSKTNLTPSYEFIFHLVKSNDYDYYPTPTQLSSNTKISLPPRHRNSDGTYSSSISPYIPKSKGKNMGDYWDEDIVRTAVANQNLGIDGEHLAPFPKQIITLPLLQSSKIGDLVLDPFCGSCNVGRVCDVLERNFVGYDVNSYLV